MKKLSIEHIACTMISTSKFRLYATKKFDRLKRLTSFWLKVRHTHGFRNIGKQMNGQAYLGSRHKLDSEKGGSCHRQQQLR